MAANAFFIDVPPEKWLIKSQSNDVSHKINWFSPILIDCLPLSRRDIGGSSRFRWFFMAARRWKRISQQSTQFECLQYTATR